MIGLIWSLEWAVATRRRRLFALNALIPLLLVGPIALSSAPAQHAAAVYTVLFTIFATFGSCIPLIRDGESGLLTRFILAGVSPRSVLTQRVLAATSLDTVQLLPSLAVIALASGNAEAFGGVLAALMLTLLVANLLGVWAAALARSVAEGALFAAVSSLLLLHAGGAFRTPVPGTLAAGVERLVPFRLLHESLLAAEGLAPVASGADLLPPILVAAALALVTLVGGWRVAIRAV
jgi:ABC-2 type transporter